MSEKSCVGLMVCPCEGCNKKVAFVVTVEHTGGAKFLMGQFKLIADSHEEPLCDLARAALDDA